MVGEGMEFRVLEVAEGRKPSGFAAPDGLRRTANLDGDEANFTVKNP